MARLAGECGEQEARTETVRATRRFVRRQRSWFRRDATTTWIDAAWPDLADRVVDLLTGPGRPAADRTIEA